MATLGFQVHSSWIQSYLCSCPRKWSFNKLIMVHGLCNCCWIFLFLIPLILMTLLTFVYLITSLQFVSPNMWCWLILKIASFHCLSSKSMNYLVTMMCPYVPIYLIGLKIISVSCCWQYFFCPSFANSPFFSVVDNVESSDLQNWLNLCWLYLEPFSHLSPDEMAKAIISSESAFMDKCHVCGQQNQHSELHQYPIRACG